MTRISLEERRELGNVVRQLLEKRSPESVVRTTMESSEGYDAALWSSLATEVGLQGLGVPEHLGGAGAGWSEVGIVLEEQGRVLACLPFLSTVGLGLSTLLEAGDVVANERWLPSLAAGELIATAAILGSPRTAESDVPLEAVEDRGMWRVTGIEDYVVDGLAAQLILVLARTPHGVSLFAVPGVDPGVKRQARATSDLTRRMSTIHFDGVQASQVGQGGNGLGVVERARHRATALLAWEQVGGASAVLDMSVGYAKVREQFGRPIGSFQAIKHKCADMLILLESARSAAWALTRAIDEGSAEVPLLADIAAAVCSEAYASCASANVQIHGGIGYTWEHPAHLYLKRSRGSAVLFGTPRDHRSALRALVPVIRDHHIPDDAFPETQQGALS